MSLPLARAGCTLCADQAHAGGGALGAPGLDWEEVDLIERPEVAERFAVMSVPAVVIDGEFAFTNVPREGELRQRIATLDTVATMRSAR